MNYVFFDIDGTLHKEDIFLEFIKFSITKRLINFLVFSPLFLILFFLYIFNSKGKKVLNAILFLLFLGVSAEKLKIMIDVFCSKFLEKYTPFKEIDKILNNHIKNGNKIIMISGTPIDFINKIYPNYANNINIKIIASTTKNELFSFFLNERCVYKNKKNMLYNFYNQKINFSHGYSDSLTDSPILDLCDKAYIVNKNGFLSVYKETSNV